MIRQTFLLSFTFLIVSQNILFAQVKKTGDFEPFETAEIYFEQNYTDGDAEVVIKAKAGDEGMLNLIVESPDGRIVIDFKAPDPSTMGVRQFHMESPEPGDIDAIKKAYPEGIYKFSGTTTDGAKYMGEAVLSHVLPQVVLVSYPSDGAEDIPVQGLEIKWKAIEGAEVYLLEVEQDELDVNIQAKLSGDENSFFIPEKFLQAGLEYKIVIGAETAIGNLNFVETTFTTSE